MSTEQYMKDQENFIRNTGVAIGSVVKLSDWGEDYTEDQINDEFGWDIGYLREWINDGHQRIVINIDPNAGFDIEGIWFPWCVIDVVYPGIALEFLDKMFVKRNKITKKDIPVLNSLCRIYPYDFIELFNSIKEES